MSTRQDGKIGEGAPLKDRGQAGALGHWCQVRGLGRSSSRPYMPAPGLATVPGDRGVGTEAETAGPQPGGAKDQAHFVGKDSVTSGSDTNVTGA